MTSDSFSVLVKTIYLKTTFFPVFYLSRLIFLTSVSQDLLICELVL